MRSYWFGPKFAALTILTLAFNALLFWGFGVLMPWCFLPTAIFWTLYSALVLLTGD